jgi:hypothetical protein
VHRSCNKSIYNLNISNILPDIKFSKQPSSDLGQKIDYSERIELDPTKPLNKQKDSFLEDYYKRWLHESIPALKGKTPTEASKTADGRKELYDLFEYMRKMQSPMPFPVDQVKRVLGL